MDQRRTRRILAFLVDINVVFFFGLVGLLLFSPFTVRAFVFSFFTYRVGQPIFFSWNIFFSFFLFGPIFLFLCFLAFSASSGQLFMGIREVDATKESRIDVVQALIHSYVLAPSFFLFGGLLQIAALFQYEERTLTQLLADTKTGWVKKREPRIKNFSLQTWMRVVCVVVGLAGMGFVNSKLLFDSTFSRKGIMIGSTKEKRADALHAVKTKRPKNSTPERAFEELRKALYARDAKALTEQFTMRGQAFIFAKARNNEIFEGLPSDIVYVRTEPINNTTVKIIYYAVVRDLIDPKEEQILFVKEIGEWKFDLMTFQKMRKSQ